MTTSTRVGVVCAMLLMSATAASPRPPQQTSQQSAAAPSAGMLQAITEAAWRRFDTVYSEGGMSGLMDAVQDCYSKSRAQRSALLKCIQIDYFAHGADAGVTDQLAGSLNPHANLRTPYFDDDAFGARRQTYTTQLAPDHADELSAALLIHAQNKVRSALSGNGPQ